MCALQLIPANRPGLAVAKWLTDSRTDSLLLEIFQEALVKSGLLEAVVLSVVLLQSGYHLGNSFDTFRHTTKYPMYTMSIQSGIP
jgi:hypothetical protein